MCKRRGGPLLLALALATPRALPAQEAGSWRDSAALLAVRVRALRDSMLQGDSTVREVARQGDLVIGASERARSEAAAALQRFIRVRERWFGGASPSVDGFRIVLRSEENQRDGIGEWSTLVLAGLPDSGNSARTQRNVSRREFAEGLIDLYGELMWASAGSETVRWLDQTPPLSLDDRDRHTLAMYFFVTGSGRAQRGCVAGELQDCAFVLGLGPSTGENRGGSYPPFVRTDLLLSALDAGGPLAWTRFRAAAGPRLEHALAAAADMPLDSLLAHWRSNLLALRPTEAPLRARGALLALGWTAALLLGALGVSRWV
jgi:hypothetical protein